MVKKGFCIFLTVLMLFSLTGCDELFGVVVLSASIIASDDRADKEVIFKFVQENQDELLQAVRARDFSTYENQGFILDIDDTSATIDFSCGGFGLAPSSTYVGFYYTGNDNKAAVWCAPYSEKLLTPSGNGYIWQEEQGDNRYYVEKICDYFYYYEASF